MKNKQARKQCQFVKANGAPCRARPITNSRFCFFHDPANAKACAAAGRKGGLKRKATTLPKESPDIPVKTADEVVGLLSITINQVRRGELDPRVGNAVGYLSSIVLRAKEQGELEERLTRIEELVLKGGPDDIQNSRTPA